MLENLTALNLALLGLAMFASGFIDAIAGGGGLIQTPAMLLSFPDRNPVQVVATSKTAAFVGASAIAKVVNATTNLASIIVVGFRLGIMWKLGLVLAVANLAGGYAGSHMAIKKGSSFIRIFYLIVTGILILRLGYSLYFE